MRKLVTTHVCPPIPDRRNDWCAHYDGDEESGDIGWGATEAEAIADFRSAAHDERLGIAPAVGRQPSHCPEADDSERDNLDETWRFADDNERVIE